MSNLGSNEQGIKVEEDGIVYLINKEEKTAGVYKTNTEEQSVIIPRSLQYEGQEYIITRIMKDSFNSPYEEITSVQFAKDSNLLIIEKEAFNKSYLEKIDIPASITTICEAAFENSTYLKEINIPNDTHLQTIKRNAFFFCPIKTLSIPSDITELQKNCFSCINNLKEIKIIERPVKNIKYYGDQNDFIIGKSDINSDNYDTIIYANRFLKELTIPLFVKTIKTDSFASTEIEKIFIPPNVTSIEEGAFSRCRYLKTLEIATDSPITQIPGYIFTLSMVECFSIPSSISEFEKEWNASVKNLSKIIVKSVKEENIKIYDENYLIGKSDKNTDNFDVLLFANKKLKDVKIPPSVKIIDRNVFEGSLIENITIPSHVTHICDNAFNKCERLLNFDIQCDSNLSFIGENAFERSSITSIFIPANITEIKNNTFRNCFRLQKVVFANDSKLKSIGNFAFQTTKIKSISIPSSVIEIGESSFHCNQLHTIEISEDAKLNSIATGLFRETKITQFVVPKNVTKIYENAFTYCRELRKFKIITGSKLETIDKMPFFGSSISSMFIPSNVKNIDKNAFGFMNKLLIIEIEDNSIDRIVFKVCKNAILMVPM